MIFWTGYGIFAFLIPVAAFLIVFLIGGGDGTETSDWFFFFSDHHCFIPTMAMGFKNAFWKVFLEQGSGYQFRIFGGHET